MDWSDCAPPDLGPGDALFLDVDGTMLEFAPTPDSVVVPPGLPPLLLGLFAALGGALAVVSGRPIRSIDRVLAPAVLPAAGQHGAEWRLRAVGSTWSVPSPPGIEQVRAALSRLAARRGDIFLETKPYSIAVHYRGAAAGLPAQIEAAIAELDVAGWQVLTSHLAFEVKRADINKGVAIKRFLADSAFRGRRPFFFGDDFTDEDGFAVVLAASGIAVRVGQVERQSHADFRLSGPSATLRWLERQLRNDGS